MTDLIAHPGPAEAAERRAMREKLASIVEHEPITRRRLIDLIEARERAYHVKIDAWEHRSTSEARQAERDHMVAALSVEQGLDRYVEEAVSRAFAAAGRAP